MAHYTRDNAPIRYSIAHLIFLLNQHKDRLLDKHLEPFNVTGAQFKVMRMIIAEQLDTPSSLCRALSVDSGAMTRMLDRLEQRGFIERSRCTNDRRQVKVKLTPEGLAFNDQVCTLAADLLNDLTADISREELEALERIVRKMLAPTGLLPDSELPE